MLVTSFSQTQKKVYVNVCVYTFCELHITFILWTRFFSAFYAAMNETNRLDERNEYTNTVENVCYCNTLISCYAFIVVAMTMLMVLLLILPFFEVHTFYISVIHISESTQLSPSSLTDFKSGRWYEMDRDGLNEKYNLKAAAVAIAQQLQ